MFSMFRTNRKIGRHDGCVEQQETSQFNVGDVAPVVETHGLKDVSPLDCLMISSVALGLGEKNRMALIITSKLPGDNVVQSIIDFDVFVQIFEQITRHVEDIRGE